MLNLVQNNPEILDNLFCSDKALFHLDGVASKQNCCYLAVEYPSEFHQQPLPSHTLTVWCTLSSSCITEPYFFEYYDGNTVNAKHYMDMINNFFTPWISEIPDQENLWFQQDGATAHIMHVSMTIPCLMSISCHNLEIWIGHPVLQTLPPPYFFFCRVNKV